MGTLTRRDLLGRMSTAAAGVTILRDARSARATPANDRLVLALVGCRSRGPALIRGFGSRSDCRLAYVADVDTERFAPSAKLAAEAQGVEPKCVQDFRKVLDDKSVHAMVIATPTHWHALATIWSCQAGKDVFVEKPLFHNPWEGLKMLEAARKYERIVQVGTQNRSAPYNLAARDYVQSGKLGKVHFVRVYNQKLWPNFPMAEDSDPPPGFNWDMWNGPAPEHRYNKTLRFNWHHVWRYCIGDLGNDGVHQFDLARMIVGFDLPKQVYCTGGRFNTTGAAETPDTQLATFTYDKLVVTLELTLYTPYMLKISPKIRESTELFPYWPQCATRIEIYGSEGVMYVGRMGGGWQVFTRPGLQEGVVKDQLKGPFPDPDHQANFVQCVRTRQKPNADIEIGLRSHLTLHYATMSYRTGGRTLAVDPETLAVDDAEAMKYFRRDGRKPWIVPDEV